MYATTATPMCPSMIGCRADTASVSAAVPMNETVEFVRANTKKLAAEFGSADVTLKSHNYINNLKDVHNRVSSNSPLSASQCASKQKITSGQHMKVLAAYQEAIVEYVGIFSQLADRCGSSMMHSWAVVDGFSTKTHSTAGMLAQLMSELHRTGAAIKRHMETALVDQADFGEVRYHMITRDMADENDIEGRDKIIAFIKAHPDDVFYAIAEYKIRVFSCMKGTTVDWQVICKDFIRSIDGPMTVGGVSLDDIAGPPTGVTVSTDEHDDAPVGEMFAIAKWLREPNMRIIRADEYAKVAGGLARE